MSKIASISLLLCINLVLTKSLNAQLNCPFIWPIDGGSCGDCAPTGWDNILTADIVDGNSWFVCPLSGLGQSPTGGNSALLYGTSNNSEGITTLVGGLTPGSIYNIAFFWTQAYAECPGGLNFGGGNLNITIDGTLYEFSGADDWEIAELCYTAQSTSAEIIITIDSNEPGIILVDSAPCEDLMTCCELEVEVNNDATVCPGEAFQFEGEYDYDQGAVTVEWECSPSDGLDYLDDRFILNPTFELPDNGDFLGEDYIFTLLVNDVVCERTDEFFLTVSPSIVPEFEISLCEVFPDFELPTTSLDGYTGYWEGDFDFADLAGTTQEYTFILDDGQDNCVESHIYELYIEEAEPVFFELPDSYCGIDRETYFLEFTSDNNVEGSWVTDGISPDRLTPDYYTYIFTPDRSLHCAFNFEYEFEIREADSLTFNIPSTFCIVQDNFVLPSVSLEGIQGDWNVDEIDVSSLGTNFEVTFIPEDIEDCYYPYVHTYEVTNSITNSFSVPMLVCENIGIYELPTVSNEGYLGFWIPSAFSFDTIFSNEVTATWFPLPDQSECLVSSNISITIENAQSLSFNLNDTICKFDPMQTLPLEDINNVTGQWSVSEIDPNVLDLGEYEYEFVPDDVFCADNYVYTFSIVEEHIPEFNLVTGFCPSQNPITLPLISDDGISGVWTIPVIDPSIPNLTSVQSTFVPNSGQDKCLVEYTETFTIDLLIDPEFDLSQIICSDVLPFTMPTRSLNGVVGTWSVPILDNTIQDQNIEVVFTPDDLSCYNTIAFGIEIIHLNQIDFQAVNPSDCFASDGSIVFNDINQDVEFSIDGGITWFTDNFIDNLPSATYTVLARAQSFISCEKEFVINLNDPDPVFFVNLDSVNISSCLIQNGQIICGSNLFDVEYSIDLGASWQTQSTFDNLGPDLYTVIVRNTAGVSCMDTAQINILDFPSTTILQTIPTDLSECSINNGSVIINAEGSDLEFSVDGQNWEDSNVFENLMAGTMWVYARSAMANDCVDSTWVEILPLQLPKVDSITIIDPSDCASTNGMVTVYATGEILEYSIDSGVTWQSGNTFSDLIAGMYTISIREFGTLTCLVEENILITDPNIPTLGIIIINDPTDCFPGSGTIEIEAFSGTSPLEYSLDGGLTWHEDNIFNDLIEGDYILQVRPVLFPNCIIEDNLKLITLNESISIIDTTIQQPSDCVTSDASVQVICDISDLEYSIDNGVNWQTSNTFSNLSEGNYEVLIQKNGIPNCFVNFEFTIINPECPCNNLDVEIEVNNISCLGPETGFIELEDLSGFYTNEGYEIEWSNGESSTLIENLTSGWYSYNIIYDLNCEIMDSVFIEDFDPITFGLLAFDKTCTDSAYIEVVDFMGGNGSFNFSLDGDFFQEDAVFYNVTPEEYQVIVMDILDCQSTDNITLNTNLDLSLEIEDIDPIYIGQSTILNPLINQTTVDSFVWMPDYNVENIGQLAIEVFPRETTEYTLTIYYGDCTETRSVIIEVIDNRTVYIANIFSLNNLDNDVLFVQGPSDLDIEIERLNIYDRWGNLVFQQDDIPLNDKSYGWDGYFNGKLAQMGVYTYLINYKLRGEDIKEAGTITFVY